ncbi:hypothetical protein BpHYR1_042380 [Brachionus plicatilis]|uniref:Uncharacterized protein n=1 Tax=Brachionus plicatilis TaxID=10195 RepID=A0A3M7QDE7_BRAPC|nr:hypothetical protein BpHYR1_042380 [Brachionus plicatilis]
MITRKDINKYSVDKKNRLIVKRQNLKKVKMVGDKWHSINGGNKLESYDVNRSVKIWLHRRTFFLTRKNQKGSRRLYIIWDKKWILVTILYISIKSLPDLLLPNFRHNFAFLGLEDPSCVNPLNYFDSNKS